MRAAEPAAALWSARACASVRCTISCTISSPCGCGSSPSSLRASAALSQASAHAKSRFSPAITTSDSMAVTDSNARRTAPTRTYVPVVSLKSSARRPRNTSPAFGSSGSAKTTASPER